MHIEIAPSRAKLLSSRGTTLELYCLASTDIRLSSAREPSRAITLRQSPARRSRVSRERLASFVTFLVSGTVSIIVIHTASVVCFVYEDSDALTNPDSYNLGLTVVTY